MKGGVRKMSEHPESNSDRGMHRCMCRLLLPDCFNGMWWQLHSTDSQGGGIKPAEIFSIHQITIACGCARGSVVSRCCQLSLSQASIVGLVLRTAAFHLISTGRQSFVSYFCKVGGWYQFVIMLWWQEEYTATTGPTKSTCPFPDL